MTWWYFIILFLNIIALCKLISYLLLLFFKNLSLFRLFQIGFVVDQIVFEISIELFVSFLIKLKEALKSQSRHKILIALKLVLRNVFHVIDKCFHLRFEIFNWIVDVKFENSFEISVIFQIVIIFQVDFLINLVNNQKFSLQLFFLFVVFQKCFCVLICDIFFFDLFEAMSPLVQKWRTFMMKILVE